ncbi:long-chain-fatty-acid--CoA ligase, partial [Pseudonocardia pini]|uniref:long-chain-fatty-acid--CoA ligase n=1 Tax=Pseudonocardia pini TaxID=2758030 RepID=UPI0015F02568
ATFQRNNQEHLEAYLAVPAMGAVLHTLNIRLSAEQLVFIAGHAEDRVLIVDGTLAAVVAPLLERMPTLRHVVVVGADDSARTALATPGVTVHDYAELLDAAPPEFDWPELDERDAAAMCYTSGTTGDPKGVVYSHRSVYLHSMACAMGDALGLTAADRVLPVVPMFHANAWGLPYAALLVGADLVLPDRFTSGADLVRVVETTRPTVAAGVPTVWSDVLGHVRARGGDLGSLRYALGGGAPVSVGLQRAMAKVCGVRLVHAWGMTETSPVALVNWPPVAEDHPDHWTYRAAQGRLLNLVEGRVVAEDGTELPRDGRAVGELEVRGPYVTAGYHRLDAPDRVHDGWLRTGDLGSIDALGYVTLSDRAKDVIKSGGEWISSVDLETAIAEHPAVREAAVIGVPDDRWQERPVAVVALHAGEAVRPAELREHLATEFASWQLPDGWSFVEEVPRTSVGKYDKKALRALYADDALAVER